MMELEACCRGLESTKVTDRSRNIKQILVLLQNEEIIKKINNGDTCSWDHIIFSTYICLFNDAEKYVEDLKKRNASTVHLQQNGQIFFDLITLALKETTTIDFSKIFGYVKNFIERKIMKECYGKPCLTTLRDSILSSPRFRSHLEGSDWNDLFSLLKGLCENDQTLVEYNYVQVECLVLLVKWGPLYSLPPETLREEFPFIARLCESITQHSLRSYKEAILKLAYQYCLHTAKDNRAACCKLGEEAVTHFIQFYEITAREDKLMIQLIDFFLLLVVLHNPMGVQENHPAAYACDITNWKRFLRTIYWLMSKEINVNLKCRNKNASLFVTANGQQELCKNFVDLFVEVSRQVLNNADVDVCTASCSRQSGQAKRQKSEINMKNLIDNIQESKKWPWIQIVYSLLKRYPDTMEESDYVILLQILCNLQKVYEDQELRHHLYECFLVMEDLQISVCITETTKTEVRNIWNIIGEAALKELGLNWCSEATENLLQKLLVKRDIFQLESILNICCVCENLKESRIRTISVYGQYYNFPKSENSPVKINLIKSILNFDTLKKSNYATCKVTAEVLTCLALKYWPVTNDVLPNITEFRLPHNDISDIYLKTFFEDSLLKEADCIEINKELEIPGIDMEAKRTLIDILETLTDNLQSDFDIETTLNMAILYKNLLNQFEKYKISPEESSKISSVLMKLLESFVLEFSKYSERYKENNMKKIIKYLDIVYSYMDGTENRSITGKIVSSLQSSFLKQLFEILNNHQATSNRYFSTEDIKFQLTQSAMKILSKYCFISCGEMITETQLHAFGAIISFEFDFSLEYEYELVKVFLAEFKKSTPGCLDDVSVQNLMEFLKNLCTAKYHIFDCALEILNCLKAILSHLIVVKSQSCISYLMQLLVPFYLRSNRFGPQVAVSIIECLEMLCNFDVNFSFTKWIEENDEEIVMSVCKFLCSDFQEIRFQAIVSVAKFFSNENMGAVFSSKQRAVFRRIFQLSLQVFEIQGNVSEERRADETVTRTASVLHSFASLVISSPAWLQESLFCLLRITHMKKLIGLEKVISLIAKFRNMPSEKELLETNLEYLLDKWSEFQFTLDTFPVQLYSCTTKLEFCTKYVDVVMPFLIENDRDTLAILARQIGKDVNEILGEYCHKVMSDSICKEDTKVLTNILENSDCLIYLIENLSLQSFKQIINRDIEKVLSHLLLVLSDEDDFRHHFDETVTFPSLHSKCITVQDFKNVIMFLESEICNVSDLLKFLIENKADKLHRLTLELKLKIQKARVDKPRLFHAYFVIIQLIVKKIKKSMSFHEYFIRDTVNYLLNLVEDFPVNPELSLVSSEALCIFLKQILPEFHAVISLLFHVIVNKLTNISVHHEKVSDSCLNILKVIIIENTDKFQAAIQTLDPFPCTHKYKELDRIYNSLKRKDISLEEDIKYFVQCGYQTRLSDTREEGLKHLKQQLFLKKGELDALYLNLKEVRGFSEDCEDSLLHQLVCMLIKLSCSEQQDVAIEACKCLGELGPSNLFTVILQPEKSLKPQNMSASEMFCGQVISRLLIYITDADINLVAASSEVLTHILNTREGKKVSKNGEDFGLGQINTNYLMPFLAHSKQKVDSSVQVNENLLVTKLNDEEIWSPSQGMSHIDWMRKLTCTIVETFSEKCFMKYLVPVCHLKLEFCEEILPYLFYLIITLTKKQLVVFLFSKIKYFFTQHWTLVFDDDFRTSDMIALNRASLATMLSCVHYIRLQKNYERSPRKPVIEDLDLNYLHLSQAAHFCSKYFTAVLYAEIWCQFEFDKIGANKLQPGSCKMLDVIYENVDERTRRALEDILRGSYETLGDFDALSGCGTSLLLDPLRRAEHYKELGKWGQALLHHEIEISNNKNSTRQLIDSLKHCGLYKVPLLCNRSEEPDFECLWRLSQWNFTEPKRSSCNVEKPSGYFEKYRYFAMKSLHDNDQYNFNEVLKKARISEIDKIKYTSLESCKNVYGILARLQSLRDMENLANVKNDAGGLDELLEIWKLQDIITRNEFHYIEPIKQQRIIMLKDVSVGSEYVRTILPQTMLSFAENARVEGHLHVATRTLGNIYFLENLSSDMKSRIQLEDAQLCWASDDKISAHHRLRQLCNDTEIEARIKSSALRLAGKWFIESLSENKHTIISNYLLESLNIYNEVTRTPDDDRNILETYDQLGRFADKEYEQVLSHINSETFQQKIKNMKKSKQTACNIRTVNSQRKLTNDEIKAVRIHEQQSIIDETEIKHAEEEKNALLIHALKYYLRSLAMSDEYNIRVFRVFSLFLENRNNPAINEIIKTYLPKIPAYKYITILPQIIPHLSNCSDNLFNQQVNIIVQKCSEEHPHHTVPLVLGLANSDRDREYTNSSTVTVTNDSRIISALALIKKLKKNQALNEIITKMEFVAAAIIQLAYYKPSHAPSTQKIFDIPSTLNIRKVKNCSKVLVPTFNLKIRRDCCYGNLVGIHSFGDKYQTVGGVNAPKRISCRGTDGKVRSQLVKGHDDLRQDAVMQQVFNIINSLLFSNKNTENLIIRTYKIVPLSMRSGIMEWVDNSMPIGTYLVGDEDEPGAHRTFRPKDKSAGECRQAIKQAANQSAEKKLQVFNSVCRSFKPVFHKFFEYSFPQPSIWYERRRAYTYSVATSSMCGYILGLGDRHVQNILVDKSTAEVIHIDFGIAFEQGRVLHTPETVPFRLTRDIVDGMGVSGVEGIFRKSCEKTMQVMRQNSQTILTILEVLLYDPLYTWTVTSAEANRRQKDRQDETYGEMSSSPSENNRNLTAERALVRLKSKLHGTENGYPVSLEHQVGTLIQQAQDPANLCKLFNGWQAYL